MHHHFAILCSRIMQFSSTAGIGYMLRATSDTVHVNMTPLTVEGRLLVKTSQTERMYS